MKTETKIETSEKTTNTGTPAKHTAATFSCLTTLGALGLGCILALTPARSLAQAAPAPGMEEHTHAPAPASTSLTLTIDGKPTTLSVADLQAMPQTSIVVHNEHTKVDESYTGVL